MKIYELGYWSHEEAPKIILSCDNSYTQEQFNDLIIDIIKNIEIYEIELYGSFNFTFEDCLEPVLKSLIDDFGFSIINSDVIFKPFGWGPLNNDGWVHDIPKNDDIYIIRKALNSNN